MKLVEIYATLFTANAEIERGFSCMKRIKTFFRNKLSGKIFDWGKYQNVEVRWKV